MSISPKLAAQAGVVTDYDGSRPCIPPAVLAEVCRRLDYVKRLELQLLALTTEPDGGAL